MTIRAGVRIGPYEILSAIGAGGMGEVYRARDTRLGRDVAVKVLPDLFAADPDRLARFEREAHVLASLNDAHIAGIYGVEDVDGVPALILELVEGETLAERIARGPIPREEALPIALQIVSALEAAHEHRIIHRDLKPANITVTPEGVVKVLDFGLAKLVEVVSGFQAPGDAASVSPTITSPAMMTGVGVLLGTAAYMSPEQAKGRAADKRSDIWAFGCVLYEMLTGVRAFRGEDVSDTLAAVLRSAPDWSRLPPDTPSSMRQLLRRALEKDPKRRLADIADARLDIDDASNAIVDAPRFIAPRVRRAVIAATLSGLIVGAAIAGFVSWNRRAVSAVTAGAVTRTVVSLPVGDRLGVAYDRPRVAISDDGSRVAYVASRGGTERLFVRAMDSLETVALAGTENAYAPMFSPDGHWIAFFAEDKLKKVSVNGGTPQILCDARVALSGDWGPNDVIAFSHDLQTGIWGVSGKGGTPRPITSTDPKANEYHSSPEFLPGGKALLFGRRVAGNREIVVQSLETGERKPLVGRGNAPHYVPTGHLVYVDQGNLMAARFDLTRLEVLGSPVAVLEGLRQPFPGRIDVAFSERGALLYVGASSAIGEENQLVWVNRTGVAEPLSAPPRFYQRPRLSPDGQQVAVSFAQGGGDTQIWLYDLRAERLRRLTFDGINQFPIWSADGQRVIFRFRPGDISTYYLMSKSADGAGASDTLVTAENTPTPLSSTPDGTAFLYTRTRSTSTDVFLLLLQGDRTPQPYLQADFSQNGAQFSPDGRWVAYVSNESGRYEIYVRSFSDARAKWQVSENGGVEPVWARNGTELFYRDGERLFAVPMETRRAFRAGKPQLLFVAQMVGAGSMSGGAGYDVAADGRFLMVKPVGQENATQITFVQNWTEELKRLVPSTGNAGQPD
jgi:eukaryotic-like serine/threonine-protein kinase